MTGLCSKITAAIAITGVMKRTKFAIRRGINHREQELRKSAADLAAEGHDRPCLQDRQPKKKSTPASALQNPLDLNFSAVQHQIQIVDLMQQ